MMDHSNQHATTNVARASSTVSNIRPARSDLTFLVHAQSLGSEPSAWRSHQPAEKFAHTRTKRTRTSAEDLAILEAEYEKTSRLNQELVASIVDRVSMSPKKIRIWFQNRRQQSRRKKSEWQRNEITAIIRDSTPKESETDNSPSCSFVGSSQECSTPELRSSQGNIGDPPVQASLSTKEVIDAALPGCSIVSDSNRVTSKHESEDGERVVVQLTDEVIQTPGEDKSRRHVAGLTEDETASSVQSSQMLTLVQDTDALNPGKSESAQTVELPTAKCNKKRHSIRWTQFQDGLAEVILKSDTPSPQKPHSQPAPLNVASSSQTSTSAQASSQPLPKLAGSTQGWPRPKTHGRSRDVRAWEFYCDSDAQNALTTAAEHDRKGSALGALGLIRSSSGSSKPLVPSKKQNVQQGRNEQWKRKDGGALEKTKPKLARTSSSFARLQTSGSEALCETGSKSAKASKPVAIWEDPDGDSDKENWEPGTQISRPRYRSAANCARAHNALQENDRALSQSSSLGAMMARDKGTRVTPRKRAVQDATPNKENVQIDEEVAAFMGDTAQDHQSEDIDAVQGLLSLSQGAWR